MGKEDLVPQDGAGEEAAAAPAQARTMKIVFGRERELGIRLGSDDPLDQLWLEVDADGDGQLGRSEVAQLLRRMGRGEAQLDAVMAELDEDKSGDIDISEFEEWYRAQPDCTVTKSAGQTPVKLVQIGAYAAKRRLRPGMRIVSLQGTDTRNLSLREVTKLLKEAGRPLTLELDITEKVKREAPGSAPRPGSILLRGVDAGVGAALGVVSGVASGVAGIAGGVADAAHAILPGSKKTQPPATGGRACCGKPAQP